MFINSLLRKGFGVLGLIGAVVLRLVQNLDSFLLRQGCGGTVVGIAVCGSMPATADCLLAGEKTS